MLKTKESLPKQYYQVLANFLMYVNVYSKRLRTIRYIIDWNSLLLWYLFSRKTQFCLQRVSIRQSNDGNSRVVWHSILNPGWWGHALVTTIIHSLVQAKHLRLIRRCNEGHFVKNCSERNASCVWKSKTKTLAAEWGSMVKRI